MGNKEYYFNLGNNRECYCIAVTKPNTLAKFSSNRGGDKFCLNCFDNFQNKVLIKKRKTFYENCNSIDRNPPRKCKTVLNKNTGEKI